MFDEIERRIRRASEGVLGNESLADNLGTDAASSLMSWGLEITKMIVMESSDIEESMAEEINYQRLRALRMLMRMVNRWGKDAPGMDRTAKSALLDQILSQAATIYGHEFVQPDESRRNAILDLEPDKTIQFITALRGMLENRME